MAGINQVTGYYEGDHQGEPSPANPVDLWCAGCRAWTHARALARHAWHAPAGVART
jgi:hypothetical protein